MYKLEIQLHEDIVNILNNLKKIEETNVQLVIPEGAIFFENVINIQLIKEWAKREEKEVSFLTKDFNGINLLSALEEKEKKEDAYHTVEELEETDQDAGLEISNHKNKLPKLKMPRINLKIKALPIILGGLFVLLIIGFFGIKYISQLPNALVKVVVNSQPLTRSFQVKIVNGVNTDAQNKICTGETISANVEESLEIPTTGEKLVGDKALGTIVIYNKTNDEKKFKKGTTLIYKDDNDKEYAYKTFEELTVPAREEQTDEGSITTYINGATEVKVEAAEIGKKYNIDEGADLEIEGQKKTEFVAEVIEDIKGGSEEKIKTVAQADIDKLKQDILENAEEKALRSLETLVTKGTKLIAGSTSVNITQEEFNHKLDDETEKISLKQTFTAKGLTYKTTALDALIDKVVESFIPEGFVLSTKERVVNVEVLGNTENTSLSDSVADVQVTLKTFVVPEISEEVIAQAVMGKTAAEAQKYLGSIRNVKTYGLQISPRVPFFDKVPKELDRIKVTLERSE